MHIDTCGQYLLKMHLNYWQVKYIKSAQIFMSLNIKINIIKRVVIETTGVCGVTSVTTLRLLRLIKFAIHRSIFPNAPGRSHWCLYRHHLVLFFVCAQSTVQSAPFNLTSFN